MGPALQLAPLPKGGWRRSRLGDSSTHELAGNELLITPQVSLHQPAAGPPPFRQGRVWGREMRIATASVRTDLAMTGFHGVWCMAGGRPRGSPLRRVTRSALRAGGQGRRPLRICGNACVGRGYKGCVGEGLCPSRGRGRTPPLRRGCKGCGGFLMARRGGRLCPPGGHLPFGGLLKTV